MHFSALVTRVVICRVLWRAPVAVPDAVRRATIEHRIRHPPSASSAGVPPTTAPPARTVATAPQIMLITNNRPSQGRVLAQYASARRKASRTAPSNSSRF